MKRGIIALLTVLVIIVAAAAVWSRGSIEPFRELAHKFKGSNPTVAGEPGVSASILPTPATSETPVPTPKPTITPTETTISLAAIGDVLLHNSVYEDAKVGDTFDFNPMFARVKGDLTGTDITFANSESIAGGKELGLSSYPQFNSPSEIADALHNNGVDIVSMANNHTMDARQAGILNAIKRWDSLGVAYVGANKDAADRERMRILEVNGVSVAFLAYTYGTNGIPVPKDKPFLVNLLDKDRIPADIAEARKAADVVVVSLHFGVEYLQEPNDDQVYWAQLAADAGADLILGHHPHVLQPVKWLDRKDGGKTLCFYSLGNFLAAQEQQYPWRQIGAIAKVDITKRVTEQGQTIEIDNVRMLPTYIKYKKWRNFQIIPLSEVTDAVLPGAEKFKATTAELLNRYGAGVKILTEAEK
jgi:poly-gamma-glutamate synthesis protein (capsule biosynthesis protein)